MSQTIKTNTVKKNAWGLYGNAFAYPNFGSYTPRIYALGDTEQGLDVLSREYLVKWSREMSSQLPFVQAAVRLLAQHSVGDAYEPLILTKDSAWNQLATDWLLQEFYPNCSIRGKTYDFQNLMYVESTLLDVDGDFLCIYGRDEYDNPKLQLIPTHRIRSVETNKVITEGPYKDHILADGVIYTPQGKAVAYSVIENRNYVDSTLENLNEVYVGTNRSQLIYDPRYIDKSRGVPSIGAGILQALSIQELDRYLTEKVKLEATVGLIEKTEDGEAPYQLQKTLEELHTTNAMYGTQIPSPNIGGVRIMQGSNIRYIKSEGGDIKTLASSSPGDQTSNYMRRLETQILSLIGVPHQLLFSPDQVGGRITTGIAEVFKASIKRRQKILDSHAKFVLSWALSDAIKRGILPETNENLLNVVSVTHPKEFTLDEGYTRRADIEDYHAGIVTLNDIAKKQNRTAEELINNKATETEMFFVKANELSKKLNLDINTVISYMRSDLQIKVSSTETNVGDSKNNLE